MYYPFKRLKIKIEISGFQFSCKKSTFLIIQPFVRDTNFPTLPKCSDKMRANYSTKNKKNFDSPSSCRLAKIGRQAQSSGGLRRKRAAEEKRSNERKKGRAFEVEVYV